MTSKSPDTTVKSIREYLDDPFLPETIENEDLSLPFEEHKTYEVAIRCGMPTGPYAGAQHVLEFTELVENF